MYTIDTGEATRHLTCRGKATHAASPWLGDNPAFKLAEVLRRLQAWQPEMDVFGVRASACYVGHAEPLGRAEPITDNVDALADELSQVSRNLGSAGCRGLSRMTLTPTEMVFGGVKSNSVPASPRLVCDVRTLPHGTKPTCGGRSTRCWPASTAQAMS